MKYENPIMNILKLDYTDILTVSGDVPSDGKNEDVNQLPGDVW